MDKQLLEQDKQRLSEALGQEGKSIFTRVHYFGGVEVKAQLLEEIIEDLQTIYNTRKKNRESSADVVQVLSKYRHKLRELEDK